MQNLEHLTGISFRPLAIAHCRLGNEWNYSNIVSPFSRLYLITEGDGFIYPNNERIKLEKGFMYLIPSLIPCSYKCMKNMEKFHSSFSIHLHSGISVYNLFRFKTKIKALDTDYKLFEKLLGLNPDMDLNVTDPTIYQVKPWLNSSYKPHNAMNALQTQSIYQMLISRFFDEEEIRYNNVSDMDFINKNFRYIHQNLSKITTIKELADRSCISPDHYTRRFKQVTGQTPIDYINQHRVEKAQLLLLTTTKTCNQISEVCGFKSNTYFSRIFKKYSQLTPEQYRQTQYKV